MNRLLIEVLKVLGVVEEVLIKRCRQIIHHPDFVHGLTNFHWWSELGV